MALTNIELYEALKKDLSEDSARMIAEVVPPAGDLATKLDVAATRADIARIDVKITEVEQRLDRRIAAAEIRLVLLFAVPLWGGTIAAVGKYLVG
jgi:hypothetical protein